MIVTVTMNPAIDKTVEIDKLILGGLNRIQNVEYDAGGKGINVSKTLCELGGSSIATGFLGGTNGKTIENVLKQKGIFCDFVHVDGRTRINTKVFEVSGAVTELNEPGPEITKEKTEELLQKLAGYAREDTLFVLSGSVPKGVDEDIYEKIIRLAHDRGAKVLLDAGGALFEKALLAVPDIIKQNDVELGEYTGLGGNLTKEQIKTTVREFLKKGTDMAVISMGKGGAMFFWNDCIIECPALSVKAHSTVGAGDAMVAALVFAWENKSEREEIATLCMAASAGAVMTTGTKPPGRDAVDELKKQVVLEYSVER